MSNKRYTAEEKYNIIKEYSEGSYIRKEIAKKYQISIYTLQMWRDRFNHYGIEGLKSSTSNKRYPKELKENAVKDYLSGKHSQYELLFKYDISSRGVLYRWIKKYNSHMELKDTKNGDRINMANRKNTDWIERIEIVNYCIANNLDYNKTAEKYKVSYQQVYSWVKKFKDGREDALKDRRGRKKETKELTSDELLKLKIKKLEAENESLKAENLLLKKLEEIERRRS